MHVCLNNVVSTDVGNCNMLRVFPDCQADGNCQEERAGTLLDEDDEVTLIFGQEPSDAALELYLNGDFVEATSDTREERAAHIGAFLQELQTHCGPRVEQVTREVELADHQILSKRPADARVTPVDRKGATPSSRGDRGGRRGLFGTSSTRKGTKSQRRAGSPSSRPATPG